MDKIHSTKEVEYRNCTLLIMEDLQGMFQVAIKLENTNKITYGYVGLINSHEGLLVGKAFVDGFYTTIE